MMSKLEFDAEMHKRWKKKRRIKMIFAAIMIGLGVLILAFSIITIVKISSNRFNKEESIMESDIEMIDLEDISPENNTDEETLEEWCEKNADKFAREQIFTAEEIKDAMYKEDISEAFPEEALEAMNEEEEEIDFVAAAPLDDGEYPIIDILLPAELQLFTMEKSKEYDVDYRLVLALMETESSFRDDIGSEQVIGKGGYYGYMQLSQYNCTRAAENGIDPHTKEGNIEWGIRYLSELLHDYNSDPEKAIAGYKGASVKSQTVKKVMNKWDYYCELFWKISEENKQ